MQIQQIALHHDHRAQIAHFILNKNIKNEKKKIIDYLNTFITLSWIVCPQLITIYKKNNNL